MFKQYLTNSFTVTCGILLASMFAISSLSNLANPPSKEVFNGGVNGQLSVNYRLGQSYFFGVRRSPDVMIISEKPNPRSVQIIVDSDGNGVIGNVIGDRYVLSLDDQVKRVYTSDFLTDERGVTFSIDGSDLEKTAVEEISHPKLEEATQLYQELRNLIQAELKYKLR